MTLDPSFPSEIAFVRDISNFIASTTSDLRCFPRRVSYLLFEISCQVIEDFFSKSFQFPLVALYYHPQCSKPFYVTLLVSLSGRTITLDALDAAFASPFIPASAQVSELVTATGKVFFISAILNPYSPWCSGLPCSHSLHTDTIMWTHLCLVIRHQSLPCRLLDCDEGTETSMNFFCMSIYYDFVSLFSLTAFDFLEKCVPLLQTLPSSGKLPKA